MVLNFEIFSLALSYYAVPRSCKIVSFLHDCRSHCLVSNTGPNPSQFPSFTCQQCNITIIYYKTFSFLPNFQESTWKGTWCIFSVKLNGWKTWFGWPMSGFLKMLLRTQVSSVWWYQRVSFNIDSSQTPMSEFLWSNEVSVVTNLYLVLQIQKAANNTPILLLHLFFFLSIFSKDLFVFILHVTLLAE